MKNRFLFIAFVIIAACSAPADQFIKSSGGMEYKIISFKQADIVHPGETLKMHIKQVYNDSVLSDTRDSIPFYQPLDSLNLNHVLLRSQLIRQNPVSVYIKHLAGSRKNKPVDITLFCSCISGEKG
jgi:hypothetical protein